MTVLEKALEIQKCKEDIAYFIEQYVVIFDTQTMDEFPFEPWDFQHELFKSWETDRRTIVLKARQLGVSWCLAIYSLWKTMFNNYVNVLMLSKTEKDAIKLLAKSIFVYDKLPKWLREWRPRTNDAVQTMEFERKNIDGETIHRGTIAALPATKEAGRSETGTIVIADEWAFHPYASTNWQALAPTIDAGGIFIGVSTANGLGNFYYQTWQKAEAKKNGFTHTFLWYGLRPGRDDVWYDETMATYDDPKMFRQEYPLNPREAFVSTSGCIFDLDGLQWLAENQVMDALNRDALIPFTQSIQNFHDNWTNYVQVWGVPHAGKRYVIGADPAGGEPTGDWSVATILDAVNGEHVATIRGKLDPDTFAAILSDAGRVYNEALICVERNNHGHAVLSGLRNSFGYGKIYVYKKDRKLKSGDNKEGHPTNVATKTKWEAKIQTEVRTLSSQMHDIEFIQEAQSYVRTNRGTTGAEFENQYDDRVTSYGMALVAKDASEARLGKPRVRTTPRRHFVTRSR